MCSGGHRHTRVGEAGVCGAEEAGGASAGAGEERSAAGD